MEKKEIDPVEQERLNGPFWQERPELIEKEHIFIEEGPDWDLKLFEPALCIQGFFEYVTGSVHQQKCQFLVNEIVELPVRQVRRLTQEGKVIPVKEIISIEKEVFEKKLKKSGLKLEELKDYFPDLYRRIEGAQRELERGIQSKNLRIFRGAVDHILKLYDIALKFQQGKDIASDPESDKLAEEMLKAREKKLQEKRDRWIRKEL
ncbi:MAG: hypothetical protein AB1606_07255 [Nitrospirota bacterium]